MSWRSWLACFCLVVGLQAGASATVRWPTYATEPGSGGFATVTVEPRHGQRVAGPDTVIRVRSDNPGAVVHVLLDGKAIGTDGGPMKHQPANLHEIVPVEFSLSPVISLLVRGLARGIHTVEVREGTRGSSLPRVNEQCIDFMVE